MLKSITGCANIIYEHTFGYQGGPQMNYAKEPHGVFFFIDNKSFYASCESVVRGLNPLKSIIVVMSEQANTNGGLVLATSPMAKKLYHITNVSRQRDVPHRADILVVPPRMNLYIKMSLKINQIYQEYAAAEDILPYSIDESLLDMTKSWRLFGDSPEAVAKIIQHRIRQEMGLYTTVGIGENPFQAKLALDLYAKHDDQLVGEIKYETVSETIGPITNLTDVWSIGQRTAKRLKQLHINTMAELAHSNPYQLKAEFGIVGYQLFALALGIDRTSLAEKRPVKEPGFSNSQVLPRDYSKYAEIRVVIKEIGEQVAARIRAHQWLTTKISLGIGFSYAVAQQGERSGFHCTKTIEATNNSHELVCELLSLFDDYWNEEPVRNIAVSFSGLMHDAGEQLSLFQPVKQQLNQTAVDQVLDRIQTEIGITSLVRASSLLPGATMINRASLVGGHNGGNAYD